MKIAQLTPGSGDTFYCENCLRDAALVKAVRAGGHDMLMIPMYLPLQTDKEQKLTSTPIFFGGINVYLQQKFKLFRRTPRWFDKLLDSPRLLGWIAKKASMTAAKDLADTTVSMLLGEDGRQTKELDRLVDWLAMEENRPDIVCLSNLLLAGLTRRLKERLNVPVVSLLQDEDGFLDGLGEYGRKAWDTLKSRCDDIDGFISVSKFYADVMKQRLDLPGDKIHTLRMGIDVSGLKDLDFEPEVPTIGYLSRICHEKGFDILVDAFIELKKQTGLESLKLRVSGGKTADDDMFVDSQKRKLQDAGVLGSVDFLEEFGSEDKLEFFEGLTLLSVPARGEAAYGLFVIESLRAGVPVVEPDMGVFRELIEDTSGGILYEPNTAEKLVETLLPILNDRELRNRYAVEGRQAAIDTYDVKRSAEVMVEILETITQRQ